MRSSMVLDKETENALNELKALENKSKSEIIREAVMEFYLKEKRARENIRFFIDLYTKGMIGKDTLFVLLPREDAENIVIGTKVGKNAAELAKSFNY